jgi:hypothetical protein
MFLDKHEVETIPSDSWNSRQDVYYCGMFVSTAG